MFLPIGGLLSYVCSLSPGKVERLYAVNINKIIIEYVSMCTEIFPFSLAEIGVIFLIVIAGWKIMRTIISSSKRTNFKMGVLNSLINILALVSLAYFIFILIWGLNYYRLTFADIVNFNVEPYSAEELANVCNSLIGRTNQLRTKVDEDQNGVMKITNGKAYILTNADIGYKRAAAYYPKLDGKYGKPKGIVFSEVMSYLGFSGVYCPFTAEPNINMAIPDVLLPATVCHEMAHQRGFAREDEANYIAYITCRLSPYPEFQYSGYLLALINSMNMLKNYDSRAYLRLQQMYSNGVRDDLKNNSDYWAGHSSFIQTITSNLNDWYLKSNGQSAGVSSYNRMVDLLNAEYRIKGWEQL